MSMVLEELGGGGDFAIPDPGQYAARCCDVVDMGIVYNKKWEKNERKISIRWLVSAEMDDGRNYMVMSRYTFSLGDKAYLRRDLEAWRGRPLTKADMPFDIEKLIGARCLLNIVHSEDGKYANVQTIMPLPKLMEGEAPDIPDNFVRAKDRDTEQSATEPNHEPPEEEPPLRRQTETFQSSEPAEDDDVPF